MEKRTGSDPQKIIRIAITGPESTGKSALAKELAHHYHTHYVREAARKYIRKLKRHYDYLDLLHIAKIQITAEKYGMAKANRILFCDTELTVIRIWSWHKFGMCPPWVERKLDEVKYDLYLLCDIDLPWEPDPQRENPHDRKYFFDKYYNELSSRNLPFVVISGQGGQRLQNAIEAVEAVGRN